MLILSRRTGEVVRLHTRDRINEVRLYDCKDRVARIGFAAPYNVAILRAEIDDTDEVSEQSLAPIPFSSGQEKTMLSLLQNFLSRCSSTIKRG